MRLVTVQKITQRITKIAAFGAVIALFFQIISPISPIRPISAASGPNLTINYLSGTEATGVWADATPAAIGEAVEFYIEIHNTNDSSTAEDLTVRVSLAPNSTAYVGASNHPTISDSTSITGLPANALLQYHSGSMRLTWDQNGDGIKEFDNYAWPNDALISAGGINLGNLLGCNPYIIQISFKADVIGIPEEPGTPQISIEKKIVWNGNEYESVGRETHLYDPDESVEYKIYVKNTGDAEAAGVKVIDHLPAYIRTLDGADKKDFNIGTLAAGKEWSEKYTAKVLSDLPQNDRTQENRAAVTSDNAGGDEDSAFVWINGPEILAAAAVAAIAAVPEAPKELPATGPAVPVALGLSGLLSAGLYLRRRLV